MDSMGEEWMSRLQCRGSIALAVMVAALLSSRPADAQILIAPLPPRGGCKRNACAGSRLATARAA